MEGLLLFQELQHCSPKDHAWKAFCFFKNFNIVLQKIAPGDIPKAVALDKMDIWVQVHDLPFGFMQEKFGKSLCD